MPDIYIKSDEKSKEIRTVAKKRENFNNNAADVYLPNVIKLLGVEFMTHPLTDEPSLPKKVRITELYPKMAIGEFYSEKTETVQKIGYSVGNLVELGLLTFVHGYPEVTV